MKPKPECSCAVVVQSFMTIPMYRDPACPRHGDNERAIREGWPWDKCASPLKIPKTKKKLSLQQSIDRLTPIFLEDINLDIYDPEIGSLFFRGN